MTLKYSLIDPTYMDVSAVFISCYITRDSPTDSSINFIKKPPDCILLCKIPWYLLRMGNLWSPLKLHEYAEDELHHERKISGFKKKKLSKYEKDDKKF